ncbi:MAG: MotA/TolQ/ExbB proton channel family protein [Coriobacteriales bacterium]|jgi:biopolymer transport protein ExbB/TolQ|nr:MotA/TolQ/ExbB proton channel family protein [Coriobacteriales bacterium]
MESFSTTASEAMRTIIGACQTPVVVLLLVAAVFVLGCIGSLVVEYFTEHRRFKVFLPRLVDELEAAGRNSREAIEGSGLLLRQKQYLIELTLHPELDDIMRESLAEGLEYGEQRRYDIITKITDLASRIAPMLGLLGTLIPLGPGILALSTGDTATLSASLLVAFDTTALGLIIAGFALIISAIRKRWYKDYMISFAAAMECVLLMQSNPGGRR